MHRYGSIGTGDLAARAELALTLAGDLPWQTGSVAPVEFGRTDALAFVSSNAVTVSVAALACADLRVLLAGPPPTAARRVQDPFGLRALPQVHGPGVDAVPSLERVVTTQINGAHENPLDRVLGPDIAAAAQLPPELAQIA